MSKPAVFFLIGLVSGIMLGVEIVHIVEASDKEAAQAEVEPAAH